MQSYGSALGENVTVAVNLVALNLGALYFDHCSSLLFVFREAKFGHRQIMDTRRLGIWRRSQSTDSFISSVDPSCG